MESFSFSQSGVGNQDVESNVSLTEEDKAVVRWIDVNKKDIANFSSQMLSFDFFFLTLAVYLLFFQIFDLGIYFSIGYFIGLTMLRIALNTRKMCIKSTSGWIGIFHLNIENIGFVGTAVKNQNEKKSGKLKEGMGMKE